MKPPTTIKGYLSIVNMLQTIAVSHLKGFENLPVNVQGDLLELTASIDNIVNEWES